MTAASPPRRYCGRIRLQHFGHEIVDQYPTIAAALDAFRRHLDDARGWRDDAACSLTLYSLDLDDDEPCWCDALRCFHDYPTRLWTLGPRDGIAAVSV
jgi:hypothetical protein